MTASRPEPRGFGAVERPLVGWLHRSAAGVPARDVGLVICKPFGYEAICAHRSLRHFADAAAAMGVPALRFDYDGTGDAAGDDRDRARWQSWVDSVHKTIDELRHETDVKRVCLLGTRLGATLAMTAAVDRDDIAGLIAIAPVVVGRQWLRELNALELAMQFAGPPPGLVARVGEQESVGFVITDETKVELHGIDLLSMTRAPAPDVLILDRDDLPPNGKLVERLSALGARVDHRRLRGYTQMMLDPHESIVPANMIEAVTEWLVERAPTTGASASVPPCPGFKVGPLPVAPGVEETAGYFSETHNLFGVLSAPIGAPRPTRAIVLLNSGAIPRIGPSRLYVQLARRWASRGYLVLRFDQAGLGDSLPFAGEAENVVYSQSAVRGVADALKFLRDQWGVTECQVMGLCSGAYHALKVAVAGLPVNGVVMINPLVFFWKPGMSLAYPPYLVSEATARYKRSLSRFDKWMKLFAGRVSLWAFAQVMARRAATHAGTFVRDIARSAGRPLREDLGADLEAVADRGVALRFVFATGDPGEDLLRSQAGRSLGRLMRDRRLRIQRIDGPNHSFTPVWTHDMLTEVLESDLDLR